MHSSLGRPGCRSGSLRSCWCPPGARFGWQFLESSVSISSMTAYRKLGQRDNKMEVSQDND